MAEEDKDFSGAVKMGQAIKTSTFAMKLNLEETDNLAEFERSDLDDSVKETLVTHASALQAGRTDIRFKKDFPVVDGVEEFSGTTPEGETVAFNPAGSVESWTTKEMENAGQQEAVAVFENNSRPGTIEVSVKKGKSSIPGDNWN